jgi:rhodanese-related sulfurtransferase
MLCDPHLPLLSTKLGVKLAKLQDPIKEANMKHLTAKSVFLLLTALIASATFAQTAKPQGGADKAPPSQAHVLNRAELDALLAKPEKLTIIDVRRPDELTSIGGFPVYLSIQLADLEKSLAWIPKDRTIVTVSNHAGRGKKAVDLLTSKGFKVAGAVGAQNYEEEGGKLTKIAPPPPKVASTEAAK